MAYQDYIKQIVDLAVSASREANYPDPVARLYHVLLDISARINERMAEMREVERELREDR